MESEIGETLSVVDELRVLWEEMNEQMVIALALKSPRVV